MRSGWLDLGRTLCCVGLLGSCTSHSESGSGAGSETETETESESGTETETETGDPGVEVSVKWIEVAASDYKLDLEPDFDAQITDYTALADGPDITVYVDVIVTADVEGVLVNTVPAALIGFRTWRSAPETGLLSPTFATIEIVAAGAEVTAYAVDVTVP